MKKKVAIIGVGRIGTRLTEQLIIDKVPCDIFLWNRSQPHLKGTILSLEIWKELIGSDTKIYRLKWNLVSNIDLIVISIKERYDPRNLLKNEFLPKWLPHDLRYVGLYRDVYLLHSLCNNLRDYRGLVLVLTNPVDVMTSLVQKWIPNATVFGAGLTLDEARLTYCIAQETKFEKPSRKCPLGGEHGKGFIPLFSLWEPSVNGVNSKIDKIVNKASRIGVSIVKDLGFTVQDCAVVFSKDINWLIHKHVDGSIRSFSVFDKGACIGWPIKVTKSNHFKIVKDIAPDELKQIRCSGEKIEEIVSRVETDCF